MEQNLIVSEYSLNRIFNFFPATMAISSLKDGLFIEVNKSFLKTLGYEREEVVGHSSKELNIFMDYEERIKMVDILEKHGEVIDIETKIRSKTGNVLTGLFSALIIETKGERCLITVFKDITELKDKERKLENISSKLTERVKELNCLHSIAMLMHMESISTEELLQKIVEVIPSGFQYHEIAGARIVIYGNEYRTESFNEKGVSIKSHISVFGKDEGFVEVSYFREEKIFCREIFLKEENTLLETIAERLGKHTERIQALKYLNDSEQRYRSIFENAVEGIFQTTPRGKFIDANPALAEMLGYDSPADLINGVTDLSTQGYTDKGERKRYLEIIEEQGLIKGFETQHFRKDGSKIWVLINARAARDETGKTIYYEGTIEDITRQKQIEEQLTYERKKFSTLTENAPFGMAMIGAEGRFSYINPKFKEIFGYELSEIPDGRTWFKKAYPDPEYRRSVIAAWIEDLKEAGVGEQRPREFTVICKDGVEKIINFVPVQLNTGEQVMSCDDITPRKKAEESVKQTMKQLRKSLAGTIQAMSLTVETRDPYTAGHQRRVAGLARAIAQEMNLTKDAIESIRMAGNVHDIGKISVPAELLAKPTKLTDIEMSLIKVHAQSGYDILKDVELPYPIAMIVLQHHERLDGSGYPQGLKGDDILLETKILSVADVVEATASNRPYRPGHGIDTALEEIEKNRGILYEMKVVDVCLKLFREKRFKFE